MLASPRLVRPLVYNRFYIHGDRGLVQRQHPEHATEIAKFPGTRLVVGSETEEGDRWNTQRIKLLIGDDVLTGRT